MNRKSIRLFDVDDINKKNYRFWGILIFFKHKRKPIRLFVELYFNIEHDIKWLKYSTKVYEEDFIKEDYEFHKLIFNFTYNDILKNIFTNPEITGFNAFKTGITSVSPLLLLATSLSVLL
jgi:uncharacterized membrane protein